MLGELAREHRRTEVWISRDESRLLEKRHSLEASRAMRSKMSLMNEFMIDMPFLEMPVSGCTCLVDVRRVRLVRDFFSWRRRPSWGFRHF